MSHSLSSQLWLLFSLQDAAVIHKVKEWLASQGSKIKVDGVS
jgi:hypothetical protein